MQNAIPTKSCTFGSVSFIRLFQYLKVLWNRTSYAFKTGVLSWKRNIFNFLWAEEVFFYFEGLK